MKVSTIILVMVAVIFLGVMTAYNFSLKASYLNRNYRNRFNESVFTPAKGLEEINVISTNMEIGIEQGDKEGVWVNNRFKDVVKISYAGGALNISLSDTSLIKRYSANGITVFVNKLHQLNLVPIVSKGVGKAGYHGIATVRIDGVRSDSLTVRLDDFCNLSIEKAELNTFSAVVGSADSRNSILTINSGTHISLANIRVPGEGTVNLMGPNITKTIYHLSDSAIVTLDGKAFNAERR